MANTKRKLAPEVQVIDVYTDDRAERLKSLEAQDQGYVYSYQDANVDGNTLARSHQEVVKAEDGSVLKHGADIIVKQPREVFEASRALESERSFQMAKRMVADPRSIKQVAQPKTPSNKENNDN